MKEKGGGLPPNLARVVHRQSGDIIERMLAADAARRGGASLKSLTLAEGIRAKSATHALCSETLKHLSVLQDLAADVGLLPRASGASADDAPPVGGKGKKAAGSAAAGGGGEAAHPRGLVLCLVYDLILGSGCAGGTPEEDAVAAAEKALRAALDKRLKQAKAKSITDLLPAHVVAAAAAAAARLRSVRVNTLKATVDEAKEALREALPEGAEIERDPLIPDVLLLPAGSRLHGHPWVDSGKVILQGRASCIPATVLAPQPGWTVVDACAAPGNKTTHLAALMRGRGRVLAFDADRDRLERLKDNARRAGAAIIQARCADFLQLDVTAPPQRDARAVLLDPSCSGSGTTATRGDALLPSAAVGAAGGGGAGGRGREVPDGRIEALARFQLAALRHALRFPRAERVVYSTCSVDSRENEGVVAAALGQATAAGYRLEAALPGWPRRGLPLVDGHENLLRTDPLEDGMEGFFVALFVRDAPPAEAGRGGGGGDGNGGKKRERGGGGEQSGGAGKKNKGGSEGGGGGDGDDAAGAAAAARAVRWVGGKGGGAAAAPQATSTGKKKHGGGGAGRRPLFK